MSSARGYIVNNGTTNSVIRATTGYKFYTSAAQRSIASTSANDTGAGTGAQQVKITYYDGNMQGPKTDTITLNGTPAVNTNATDIQFVERVDVIQVGSGGSNAGTIRIFDNPAGGGGFFDCIAAGDNASFWAHHYVAAGHGTQITRAHSSAMSQSGQVSLQTQGDPRLANTLQVNFGGTWRHGLTNTEYEHDPPLLIAGPNFIIMLEKPDATTVGTNTVFGAFDFLDQ